MIIRSDKVKNFYDIFDVGEITRVQEAHYVVDVLTEDGKHLLDVPFIYNYIFSGPVLTKEGSTQYYKDKDGKVLINSVAYNEGQGMLYMPEVGTKVLILYIKNKPYIFGFFLPNTPDLDNRYNKPTLMQGELRFQVRDGAYLHIRRNGELDIFATPLARMILTSVENTMKLFLENAFEYFNVGHIFFTTDYDDGSTDYEIWLRPNMSTKKNYFKMTVGSKPDLIKLHVARTKEKDYKNEDDSREEIPVWDMHIREDGNTTLKISTDPDDKGMKSRLEWSLGKDDKYQFQLITDNDAKVKINMDADGNVNIHIKGDTNLHIEGNLNGEIDKAMTLHSKQASTIKCDQNLTVKSDRDLILQGQMVRIN